MAAKNLDNRVFVGGLSWEVTERQLEDGFRRFGKVVDCEIMVERDTGRPRGFGFLTFSDRRAVEDAIREMHDREFGGRVISVNRAEPRPAENPPNAYGGGYSSGARGGGYRGGNDRTPRLDDECFKCGRPGHWARDCPSGGGGGRAGDPVFSSRSRYLDDRPVARGGDRFGDRDRYVDDRYDAGRFADRDRFDTRDRYPVRDRFAADRYPVGGDRYAGGDRYRGGFDRYPADVYEKDRPFERDVGLRRGSDRYGAGGPARSTGRNFGERVAPYERPPRGGRPSSYERY